MLSTLPRHGLWVLMLLLVGLSGCRQGSAPLSPVRGKVSYQGNLLPSGLIVFTPDAGKGTVGDVAYGEIQPDGSYTLNTGDRPGVVAGWHRVTVASIRPTTGAQPSQAYVIPGSLIPEKYRDPQYSGLECEIKADKANTIDFHLE